MFLLRPWFTRNLAVSDVVNLKENMSSDGKKISFSFSKVKKTPLISKSNEELKDEVEFVDCFDGAKGTFSYKGNVKTEQTSKQELVIPLISTNTASDIIKLKIEEKARKERTKNVYESDSNNESNSDRSKEKLKSLEEQAVIEILTDLKNNEHKKIDSNKLIIQAHELVTPNETEAEIDYENVPVSDFGLAMLRGMGWKPGCGIGKEPRVVETVSPKLRPKGLGLGAKPLVEVENSKDKSK